MLPVAPLHRLAALLCVPHTPRLRGLLMRLIFAVLLASTTIAGAAIAAAPVSMLQAVATGGTPAVAGAPTYGTFGFDTAGMDKSVKPGDNFYNYASGTWQKTTVIPQDRSSYGMFHKLQDLSLERTRGIL